MELFYECSRSKSVLNVLGPIAQKIVELKRNHNGAVCEPEVIIYLIKQCEFLKIASCKLKNQLSEEAEKIGDNIFLRSINELHMPFIQCIDALTDTTKDLFRGDIHVKDNDEVWQDLIMHSEDILGCLIKILLSWDLSLLRKINTSLDVFIVAVESLRVAVLKQLPSLFEDVVLRLRESLLLLEGRMNNICLKSQRDSLHIYALQLHKTLPLLANVAANCARQPLKDAKYCCNFVIDKIKDLVENIRREAGLGSAEYNHQEPGKYIHTLNRLFGDITVNPGERGLDKLPLLNSIKLPMELVLQHCVGVALCLSSEDYSTIMTACESVLQQMKILSKIESMEHPRVTDVDVLLDVLVDVLEILEIKVNLSLLKFSVQTFTEPFISLEAMLLELENKDCGNSSGDVSRIETRITAFEEDVDKYFQIAGFVIACIADAPRVREIESTLTMLEWLESGIISAVRKASFSNGYHLHSTMIRNLVKHWMDQVLFLRSNIYLMVEPDALLPVTKHEIHTIWSELRQNINNSGDIWFKERVRRVCALTQQLLKLNEDNNYLTDEQTAQISKGLSQVRNYETKVLNTDFDESVYKSFVKRLQFLLTVISRAASSFSRDSFSSDNERDFYGYREYEEGYAAAKKQFCETITPEIGTSILSNISAVQLDITDEPFANQSEIVEPKSSTQNSNISVQSGVGAQSSCREQRTIRVVRRTSRAKTIQKPYAARNEDKSKVEVDGHLEDVSIDITKFLLCRSTNTFRNSARASKRNFSLKVKEIDLDIGEVIKINKEGAAPKNVVAQTCFVDGSTFVSGYTSFSEFAGLIERMEKITSSYYTTIRKYPYLDNETFAGFGTEKEFKTKNLFYKSTHPLLPDNSPFLKPRQEANVDSKSGCSFAKNENFDNDGMHFKGKCRLEPEGSSSMINFGADTRPTISKSADTRTTSLESPDTMPTIDFTACVTTPSSLDVKTPERLEDLQTVKEKLASLKFVLDM